jgi:hypothetical protein
MEYFPAVDVGQVDDLFQKVTFVHHSSLLMAGACSMEWRVVERRKHENHKAIQPTKPYPGEEYVKSQLNPHELHLL